MALDVNDLKALKAAFPRADHEFRQGYVYLTEDAITNRIEEVDPAWSFDIQRMDRIGDQTIVCARMTIKDVSREGVGMQLVTSNSNAEPEKGAATDALKRCARLFGIGRYLLNAPKEGQSFDTWLAGQQKALNGVSVPESGSNGHVSTSQPSAGVRGAGVNRPTPPPASVAEPPAPSGASDDNPLFDDVEDAVITAIRPDEQVGDDDPNRRGVDCIVVTRSGKSKAVAFGIVNSHNRIPVIGEHNLSLLVGVEYRGEPIAERDSNGNIVIRLDVGTHDLDEEWGIYGIHDKDGWTLEKIVTERIPLP